MNNYNKFHTSSGAHRDGKAEQRHPWFVQNNTMCWLVNGNGRIMRAESMIMTVNFLKNKIRERMYENF